MPILFYVLHLRLRAFLTLFSFFYPLSCLHSHPCSFDYFNVSSFAFSSPLSRCAVPLQTPEELDDSDFETEDLYDVRSRTSVQTEDDQLIAGQSARVS